MASLRISFLLPWFLKIPIINMTHMDFKILNFLFIKHGQISLNLLFVLTNYKRQGQTFDKLIVDLYKPPKHMTIIMHNMYWLFFVHNSIEVVIIQWDIQNEDIQNTSPKY